MTIGPGRKERKPPITLGPWCTEYLAKRTDLKASTREQFDISSQNLQGCFGESKPLESFHAGDGDDFRTWLISTKTLSENTARRRMGRAKQLFNAAVRRKLLAANPFQDQKAAVGSNPKRQQFVPHEWIERCIRKSPCESWRIIIALARYGGLRRDECLQVRWADVDIPAKRFIVRATKTEHCEDGGVRIVPIFPELLPHMMRCKEMAAEGAEFLQSRYKSGDNIGTQFKRIIELAGVMPWPKLFQNLRASRETELLARFPAKDVAAWLGNSVPVAMKHYAMATAESFDRATAEGAKGMEAIVTAAKTEAKKLHPNTHPTATLSSPQQPTAGSRPTKKPWINQGL